MLQTDIVTDAQLRERLAGVFGSDHEPMSTVVLRAEATFPDRRVIAWEGDAQTFAFSFVSESAEDVLGYPRSRWVTEPSFWADTVVHPDDKNDAIAFCAVATGRCQDHDFVYRATTADGQTVWLHDVVKVIRGERGIARTLRGLMLDVTPSSEEAA